MPASYTSGGTAFITEASGIVGQSRSSFLNRFQDQYLPRWDDYVHTGTKVAKKLSKKKGTMDGALSLGSVMHQYPASAGIARFEGDDLPTPYAGAYFNPRLISRQLFTRLRWTWQVIKSARGGKGAAWADPKKEDMSSAEKQFQINFERQLITGNAQILATVQTYTSGTPDLTLYGRNTRTSASADRWKFGAHYLRVGQEVAVVDNVVGVLEGTTDDNTSSDNIRRILSISNPNNDAVTITVSTSSGTTATTMPSDISSTDDGAILVPFRSRLNAASMSGTDNEGYDSKFAGPNGLLNLIVNSNWKNYVYGLSRTTFPSLEGFLHDNSGTLRTWDTRLLELAAHNIQDEGTGDDPNWIVMHNSMMREFVSEVAGDRRFEPVQTKRGYTKPAVMIGDVYLPIDTARDVPPGLAFVLDTGSFGWFSEAEMQMVDEGQRFVADKAAHEIVLAKSGNEVCVKPHNNAIVDDITYSVSSLTA